LEIEKEIKKKEGMNLNDSKTY